MHLKNSVKKQCHIFQMLKAHARKKHLSFHTPGHKNGKWDITELSYSDNLVSPNGCIARAQRDITQILGSEKSFIITDGSTLGIHAMLYTAKRLGVKTLAISPLSHQSVFSGLAIFDLQAVTFVSPSVEHIAPALENADALLITSPDYYGNIPNLSAISALCKSQNKLLIIDGAHGGHLHFDKNLYAGTYADLWVDGVHKSLPALTQGAVVSAKSEKTANALQESVLALRTSSPSYPNMASVEYAVKYPEHKRLENAVREFANKYPLRVSVNQDWTKLCVYFGKHAFKAQKALEQRGIYPEFCDGENVLFYLSPATKIRDVKRLKKTLDKAFIKYPCVKKETDYQIPAPSLFLKDVETEWVELEKSIGQICAVSCGLFPPCTPLIHAGEVIEESKIETLKKAKNAFGLKEGAICIVKEARQL